ncbi:MAG: VWA domain-containing protein [Myxococcota bacterium]|nr:VWA domain-containing protein [Myxococcota bacterium]
MCRTLNIHLFLSLLLALALFGCSDSQETASWDTGTSEYAPDSSSSDSWGGDSGSSAPESATSTDSAGDTGAGAPPSNDSDAEMSEPDSDAEPEPADEPETNWIQLSTDDSTSMASAQMYKTGAFTGSALKVHEFINYYDAPEGMFESETWAFSGDVTDGIRYGVKADLSTVEPEAQLDCEAGQDCEDREPYQLAEVLFQMNAERIDRDERRNWNIFLCVDVSGSMAGDNMEYVRQSLDQMLVHFKEGDLITLVTFDSNYHDIFLNYEFSANEDAIREHFSELRPGSSTNMIAGLNRVYELAQSNFNEDMLQRVILFGDGNANVGNTDLDRFNELTRMNGQEGIYLSGVGVGTHYDWDRMDQLTDAGKGAHVFLPDSNEVNLIFGDYFNKLVEVAADQISIEMTLPQDVTLESFTGEEVSTNPDERLQNIILAAGDDMTFIARFKVGREEALDEPATLTLTMRPLSTGEEVVFTVDMERFGDLVENPGELFERTRIVHDFGKLACGTPVPGVDAEDLLETLSGSTTLDWGLQEIQGLLNR